MSNSNILLALPREMFAYILSFLNLDDMTNLEKSSREMKKRFVSENIWENHARSLYHKGKFEASWMRGVLFKPDAKVGIPGRSPDPPMNLQMVQYHGEDDDFSDYIIIAWWHHVYKNRAKITHFELYVHKETEDGVPSDMELWDNFFNIVNGPDLCLSSGSWFRVGINQKGFKTHQKYHFSVRAKDNYGRFGSFSTSKSITIQPKKKTQ